MAHIFMNKPLDPKHVTCLSSPPNAIPVSLRATIPLPGPTSDVEVPPAATSEIFYDCNGGLSPLAPTLRHATVPDPWTLIVQPRSRLDAKWSQGASAAPLPPPPPQSRSPWSRTPPDRSPLPSSVPLVMASMSLGSQLGQTGPRLHRRLSRFSFLPFPFPYFHFD